MSVSDWFLCFRPRPQAKVRIFAFPYAGAGASIYRSWGEELPPEIELVAVQLPGHESRAREKAHDSLATLLDPLAQAVRTKLTLPAAFFGHSMGGLVAFELARQLRKSGGPNPIQLFISARAAPHLPDRAAAIHALPERELIATVGERYQAIPQPILEERDLLELLLPTLRADLKLVEKRSYRSEGPLSTPISVFGGSRDRVAQETDLRAWSEHTSGAFSFTVFEGDHFFLNEPATRPLLLQAISGQLLQLVERR